MGAEHAPLVLIEVILVFGGVLLFGWWQLRSVERDRRELQRRRQAEAHSQAPAEAPPGAPADPTRDETRPPEKDDGHLDR